MSIGEAACSIANDQAIPDISKLPGDALLTDRQKAAHSGFSISAFKQWRREGRGPATIYIEGRPRSTVSAYRKWLSEASAPANEGIR